MPVVFDVDRRRHHVDQAGDVSWTANVREFAPPFEFVTDKDEVRRLLAFVQVPGHLINLAVGNPVEVIGLEETSNPHDRIAVDQDAAEN